MKCFFINRRWYIYLFSGTDIHGQEKLKLRPNWTVTEVDRDRDQIKIWTEWCAKNWTVTGTAQPYWLMTRSKTYELDILTRQTDDRMMTGYIDIYLLELSFTKQEINLPPVISFIYPIRQKTWSDKESREFNCECMKWRLEE